MNGALSRINDVTSDKGAFCHQLSYTHPVPVVKLLAAQRLGRRMPVLLAPIGNGLTIDLVLYGNVDTMIATRRFNTQNPGWRLASRAMRSGVISKKSSPLRPR